MENEAPPPKLRDFPSTGAPLAMVLLKASPASGQPGVGPGLPATASGLGEGLPREEQEPLRGWLVVTGESPVAFVWELLPGRGV